MIQIWRITTIRCELREKPDGEIYNGLLCAFLAHFMLDSC